MASGKVNTSEWIPISDISALPDDFNEVGILSKGWHSNISWGRHSEDFVIIPRVMFEETWDNTKGCLQIFSNCYWYDSGNRAYIVHYITVNETTKSYSAGLYVGGGIWDRRESKLFYR